MKPFLAVGLVATGILACSPEHEHRIWTQIGSESSTRYYIDLPSIIQADGTAVIWTMRSFDEPKMDPDTETPYLSQAELIEFDCFNKRGRLLEYRRYTHTLAQGSFVVSDTTPDNEWHDIIEGSQRMTKWTIACGI